MKNTEKVRLNKYLSEAGVCSRREADRLIEEGKVFVNGKSAEPGMKVNDLDKIIADGKEVLSREKKVVLAYYKPVGVVCTERDRHAQVTIKDVLDYPVRVTYAGRLDKDSEGLLLMTNDGDLINGLMRAANFHEKEYLVRVNKPISREFLKKMSEGVMLKELDVKTRPCFVKEEGKFVFRIILTQGLNRQIRRMCKTLGYDVKSIRRVRVANILLGDLEPGKIRPVTGTERRELYEQVEKSMKTGAARKNAEAKQSAAPAAAKKSAGQTAGRRTDMRSRRQDRQA
ncbi:MAG: pseudouridine synthase [Eubacteriales bacterium]|nr:pseudouridine synthase [Eubacteriales bacterium]